MNAKQRKAAGRKAIAPRTRSGRLGKWLAEVMSSAAAKASVTVAAAILNAVLMACIPAGLAPHKGPAESSAAPAAHVQQA